MAEGGGDNPFSFNKFVKTRTDDPLDDSSSTEESEEDNVVDLLENSAVLDKEENERKKNSAENPFSFKKFLQAGQGGGMAGRHPLTNNGGGLATLDLASDLPDFVQDHYHHTNGGDRSRHQPANEVVACLPDFALDSAGASASSNNGAVAAAAASGASEPRDVQYLFPTAVGGGLPLPDIENQHLRHGGNNNAAAANLPVVNRKSLISGDFDDIHDSDLDEGDVAMVTDSPLADRTNSTGGLPDFLSDSAFSGGILNASSRLTFAEGTSASRAQTNGLNGFRPGHMAADDSFEDDDSVRVRQLKEINRGLQAQLKEAQELALRESARVAETLREMEARRKREAEETVALETMMQQVENNLETTTQRALTAESTIVKLKQDVKNLQTENELLRKRSGGGATGGGGVATTGDTSLQDTAMYAARQIDAAASSAEQLLKQLLSGVESLKQVSVVLSSADKFADLPSSSSDSSRRDSADNCKKTSGT